VPNGFFSPCLGLHSEVFSHFETDCSNLASSISLTQPMMNSNARIRVFVVIMFLLMGGLLYIAFNRMQENIQGLVKTVKESSEPDMNLVRIKELWAGINNASANIRAYTVTRDESYLEGFLTLKDSLLAGIDSLKAAAVLSGRDSGPYLEIEKGLKKKIGVYDDLLEINYNRVFTSEIEQADTMSVVADTSKLLSDEGNFFQRMFTSKYSRKALKARADSLITERNNRLQAYRQDVKRIREEEARQLKEQADRELQLIEADKEISQQMGGLIAALEHAEQERIIKRASSSRETAAEAASEIKKIVFGGVALIILLLILVLRDVQISGKRRKELIAARQQAEKLARAKEEFMSTMSHEIRTPLTSVIGFSEKLKQTRLDDTQMRFMKAITGSSEHLLSIVNDVLDFTRVDSGKLKFDNIPFNAAQIFTDVYDALFWKAHEKHIDLNLFVQPVSTLVLHGDPVRLRQVLFNLVGNAIKFTDKGSVDITATFVDENEKAVLLFKVSDTGIGIPPERLDAVFNEFEQAEASTERKYGGSGLGLSITKRIIDQQGGTIKVESNPGLGSIFSVRIPFSHGVLEPRETSYTEEIAPQPLDGLTILLAEDDPMIRELQLHSLESMGARVIVAGNGREALEQFMMNDVSLILMDIQMPEVTGVEAMKIIRKDFPENKQQVPIIAMTANVLQHDLKQWLEEGMNDFVTKPFRESELIEKIGKVLNLETKVMVPVSKEPPKIRKEISYEFNLPRPEKLYDLKELLETSQGNQEFTRKMINLFLTSSFASVNNLKFHLKRNNWDQLGKTAHRMIGSYKQMGIDYVASMLKELEDTSLGSRELGKAAFLVSETEKYSNEVFQHLKNELDNFQS
jgi:signal transduction histidine kinase/DNA-binding response OmpR family regulator